MNTEAWPVPALQPMPDVSVVIPTYRRPDLLQRCLRAVLSQTLPADQYEVLVVDDGCTDDTRALVRTMELAHPQGPRLRYLRRAHVDDAHGPARARNLGWRTARGELIAFTDDDTVPAPDWLAQALTATQRGALHGPQPVAWAGRVHVPLSPHERRWPTDHQRMTLGLEQAEFVTANAFVRRDALQRVGGFDERFLRAWREDSDLQFRLMRDVGPVARCDDAVVAHPVRPERWGVCLRQQRNAFFDALLYKKHPRLYRERIRPVPPWRYYGIVFSTALAAAAALAGATAQGAGWWWVAGIWALVALGAIAGFAQQRLRGAAQDARHVVEMVATSALIPFLSVYWRLRGAWHFRVLFW